jgi:hypothetical protein
MKTTKVVAQVCFPGDPSYHSDPAGAAVALARQGFEVTLMPERYRAMLDVPGDDHLEASKRVLGVDFAVLMDEAGKVMDEVDAIEHGRGIALLHARTEAGWFEPIWESAAAIRRWLIDRQIYRLSSQGDALIEALRTATDWHRARQHTLAEERTCLGNISADFAALPASKQLVLRVVALILRSL